MPETSQSTSHKKSFLQLRSEHHFDIMMLAESAMVHPEIVYKLLLGDPVPRDYAIMVLNAYNKINGTHYSLSTVDMKLTTILI